VSVAPNGAQFGEPDVPEGAAAPERGGQAGHPAEGPVQLAELRQAYVNACLHDVERERVRLRDQLETRRAELNRLSTEMRMLARELHGGRRKLAGLEEEAAEERASFERDFDELLALPGVRRVEAVGSMIRVLTEPVMIEYEGHRYRIGEFAIELSLDFGIKIVNLNNTSWTTGWDHPHVQGGYPCLGNLKEGCEMLLGEFQLVPLVSMLLQFLESYDRPSAYGPITLWKREDA
jgi:hypothetical protein